MRNTSPGNLSSIAHSSNEPRQTSFPYREQNERHASDADLPAPYLTQSLMKSVGHTDRDHLRAQSMRRKAQPVLVLVIQPYAEWLLKPILHSSSGREEVISQIGYRSCANIVRRRRKVEDTAPIQRLQIRS